MPSTWPRCWRNSRTTQNSREDVIHDLTTFPTGRPELIQAGELLADKLPNNTESRFWVAIAALPCRQVRGGRVAVLSAAAESPLRLTSGAGWPRMDANFSGVSCHDQSQAERSPGGRRVAFQGKGGIEKAVIERPRHGPWGLWGELVGPTERRSPSGRGRGPYRGSQATRISHLARQAGPQPRSALVEQKGEDVIVRKRDGKDVTLAISRLSEEDVKWLGQQRK